MFRKKWRLTMKMKMSGEPDFLAYFTQDYRFYWMARFDAWNLFQSRPADTAIMSQIDNLPRDAS